MSIVTPYGIMLHLSTYPFIDVQIESLNDCPLSIVQLHATNRVVHFRGTIRDCHGPEIFMSSVKAIGDNSSIQLSGVLRNTIICPV
jgi:hypothetical protein